MEDANLGGSEIDAVYVGNMSAARFINQQHIDALVSDYTGMATRNVPAIRTEAGGAEPFPVGGVPHFEGERCEG